MTQFPERRTCTAAGTNRSPPLRQKTIDNLLMSPVATSLQTLKPSTEKSSAVVKAYSKLYDTLLSECANVISSYRKFDRFKNKQVNFQEFAFTLEELGLRFERDLVQ